MESNVTKRSGHAKWITKIIQASPIEFDMLDLTTLMIIEVYKFLFLFMRNQFNLPQLQEVLLLHQQIWFLITCLMKRKMMEQTTHQNILIQVVTTMASIALKDGHYMQFNLEVETFVCSSLKQLGPSWINIIQSSKCHLVRPLVRCLIW